MLSKVLALADTLLELMIFAYEVFRLRHLEKENVDVVVRFSEMERRVVYAKRYLSVGTLSNSLILIGVLISYVAMPAKQCNDQQALEMKSICSDC